MLRPTKNKLTMTIKYFLIWAAVFSLTVAHGQQSKIDSLQNILSTAKKDTNKVNTLNALSRELLNQGDYEKAIQYANDGIAIVNSHPSALGGSESAEMLKQVQHDPTLMTFLKGKATAYHNIGNIHYN